MRRQVCARHRRGFAAVVFELARCVLLFAATVAGRFLSGRPMLREIGPADSTYTEWADLDGARLARRMRVAVPRSRWARRPGYQRQVVRLSALTLALAFLAVPVVTTAAVTGATVAGFVGWFLSRGWPGPEREASGRAWPYTPHESFSPRVGGSAGRPRVRHYDAMGPICEQQVRSARVRPAPEPSYEPLQRPAPVYARAERLDQGGAR